MESRSTLERGVAWLLFLLLVAGAAVSIAVDLADDGGGAPSGDPASPNPPTSADMEADSAVTEDSAITETVQEDPPHFTIAATGDLFIDETITTQRPSG